jgi:hypothetical protein
MSTGEPKLTPSMAEKAKNVGRNIRDIFTPTGNAPFDSAEKMEKSFTDFKWDIVFTTHPRYYVGGCLRPWTIFNRTGKLGEWKVTEGFCELVDPKEGKTVERKFEGTCSMQGDPKRPWDFEMKQSGVFNMFGKSSRWKIVEYNEVDGVAAVCYDKTFDLQDKPSCHVLVKDVNKHVMVGKDKETPMIRSAMDAIRRQHNYRDMGGDIKPCAGTPYVKVHHYLV